MALKLGIQTYQILTNDDEVCIPSLSRILLAVMAEITDAIAQKICFSLPGKGTVKEAGAILAFEAIKSANEVFTPSIPEMIWVKNVRAIVVYGVLIKFLKKHILKI